MSVSIERKPAVPRSVRLGIAVVPPGAGVRNRGRDCIGGSLPDRKKKRGEAAEPAERPLPGTPILWRP
jgi:hypothetical protein